MPRFSKPRHPRGFSRVRLQVCGRGFTPRPHTGCSLHRPVSALADSDDLVGPDKMILHRLAGGSQGAGAVGGGCSESSSGWQNFPDNGGELFGGRQLALELRRQFRPELILRHADGICL